MTIDEAIRRTFPTGLLHEPVLIDADMERTQKLVTEIATEICRLTSLQVEHQLRFGDDRYFKFAATLPPAPTPKDWLHRRKSSAQLAYLREHGPLPVLWVQFSFVFPVWHHFFNLWTFRPTPPPNFDTCWTEDAPSPEWATTLAVTERVAASFGFSPMPQTGFYPRVEFVRHEVYSDDDDDDSPPRLETCSIGQCLFSEC